MRNDGHNNKFAPGSLWGDKRNARPIQLITGPGGRRRQSIPEQRPHTASSHLERALRPSAGGITRCAQNAVPHCPLRPAHPDAAAMTPRDPSTPRGTNHRPALPGPEDAPPLGPRPGDIRPRGVASPIRQSAPSRPSEQHVRGRQFGATDASPVPDGPSRRGYVAAAAAPDLGIGRSGP